MDEFGMSDKQAKAVREMQLQRLAGLEREKIEEELNNLLITIADLKDILANEERILEIIRNELLEMKENMEINVVLKSSKVHLILKMKI